MVIEAKPGQNLRVTITKTIDRESARKTIERLFMTDKEFRKPIDVRSGNFKAQPKRRGGRIWTKRPNKLHPELIKGKAATIKSTPQVLKDLGSVETFVEIVAQ